MTQLSIGEFARQTQLSPKALRLYDELGLLPPTRVDPDSGYRWYESDQLEQARLVATLRQIGIPLAKIKLIISLERPAAAQSVAAYWNAVEADHTARRELVTYLINHLKGKESVMYEVATRTVAARSLLCLQRSVSSEPEVVALGKEFVALLKDRPLPQLEGITGAPFVIYHGEVSEDSDGPIEWCRPLASAHAEEIAAGFPELTLRNEPAHEEAFVHLGAAPQLSAAQWQTASETLRSWAAGEHQQPSELGVRVTLLVQPPLTADSVPDCDFAVPLR